MLGEPWVYLWVAQFANPFSGPESTVSGRRLRVKAACEDAEQGCRSLPEPPAAWAPRRLPNCPTSPAPSCSAPCLTPAQAQGLSHPLALILLLILSYNSHLSDFPETT